MKTAIQISLFFLLAATIFLPSSIANSEMSSDDELLGDGTVTLYRPDKNERSTFVYRDEDGFYDHEVLDQIDHFFRCRLTGEVHQIDPLLIALLDEIEDHFDAREIQVISGYRSPLRNSIMSSRNRRVAKGSLHTIGMAADIKILGVLNTAIRNFAYSLGKGGVGYYGQRSFVHVDTGEIRTWGWSPSTSVGRRSAGAKK